MSRSYTLNSRNGKETLLERRIQLSMDGQRLLEIASQVTKAMNLTQLRNIFTSSDDEDFSRMLISVRKRVTENLLHLAEAELKNTMIDEHASMLIEKNQLLSGYKVFKPKNKKLNVVDAIGMAVLGINGATLDFYLLLVWNFVKRQRLACSCSDCCYLVKQITGQLSGDAIITEISIMLQANIIRFSDNTSTNVMKVFKMSCRDQLLNAVYVYYYDNWQMYSPLFRCHQHTAASYLLQSKNSSRLLTKNINALNNCERLAIRHIGQKESPTELLRFMEKNSNIFDSEFRTMGASLQPVQYNSGQIPYAEWFQNNWKVDELCPVLPYGTGTSRDSSVLYHDPAVMLMAAVSNSITGANIHSCMLYIVVEGLWRKLSLSLATNEKIQGIGEETLKKIATACILVGRPCCIFLETDQKLVPVTINLQNCSCSPFFYILHDSMQFYGLMHTTSGRSSISIEDPMCYQVEFEIEKWRRSPLAYITEQQTFIVQKVEAMVFTVPRNMNYPGFEMTIENDDDIGCLESLNIDLCAGENEKMLMDLFGENSSLDTTLIRIATIAEEYLEKHKKFKTDFIISEFAEAVKSSLCVQKSKLEKALLILRNSQVIFHQTYIDETTWEEDCGKFTQDPRTIDSADKCLFQNGLRDFRAIWVPPSGQCLFECLSVYYFGKPDNYRMFKILSLYIWSEQFSFYDLETIGNFIENPWSAIHYEILKEIRNISIADYTVLRKESPDQVVELFPSDFAVALAAHMLRRNIILLQYNEQLEGLAKRKVGLQEELRTNIPLLLFNNHFSPLLMVFRDEKTAAGFYFGPTTPYFLSDPAKQSSYEKSFSDSISHKCPIMSKREKSYIKNPQSNSWLYLERKLMKDESVYQEHITGSCTPTFRVSDSAFDDILRYFELVHSYHMRCLQADGLAFYIKHEEDEKKIDPSSYDIFKQLTYNVSSVDALLEKVTTDIATLSYTNMYCQLKRKEPVATTYTLLNRIMGQHFGTSAFLLLHGAVIGGGFSPYLLNTNIINLGPGTIQLELVGPTQFENLCNLIKRRYDRFLGGDGENILPSCSLFNDRKVYIPASALTLAGIKVETVVVEPGHGIMSRESAYIQGLSLGMSAIEITFATLDCYERLADPENNQISLLPNCLCHPNAFDTAGCLAKTVKQRGGLLLPKWAEKSEESGEPPLSSECPSNLEDSVGAMNDAGECTSDDPESIIEDCIVIESDVPDVDEEIMEETHNGSSVLQDEGSGSRNAVQKAETEGPGYNAVCTDQENEDLSNDDGQGSSEQQVDADTTPRRATRSSTGNLPKPRLSKEQMRACLETDRNAKKSKASSTGKQKRKSDGDQNANEEQQPAPPAGEIATGRPGKSSTLQKWSKPLQPPRKNRGVQPKILGQGENQIYQCVMVHQNQKTPCLNTFTKLSNYTRHVRQATGQPRGFRCGVCLKEFEGKELPPEVDQFTGIYNGKVCMFKRFDDLVAHMGTHTTIIWRCDACQRPFSGEKYLKRHQRAVDSEGLTACDRFMSRSASAAEVLVPIDERDGGEEDEQEDTGEACGEEVGDKEMELDSQ